MRISQSSLSGLVKLCLLSGWELCGWRKVVIFLKTRSSIGFGAIESGFGHFGRALECACNCSFRPPLTSLQLFLSEFLSRRWQRVWTLSCEKTDGVREVQIDVARRAWCEIDSDAGSGKQETNLLQLSDQLYRFSCVGIVDFCAVAVQLDGCRVVGGWVLLDRCGWDSDYLSPIADASKFQDTEVVRTMFGDDFALQRAGNTGSVGRVASTAPYRIGSSRRSA